MVNLRQQAESDLGLTLEGENWGVLVKLVAPDGARIETNQNTGEPLKGQVLYDTVRINPDSGEEMVVNDPVVSLRRSSLSQVPKAGETWLVEIPVDPTIGAPFVQYVITSDRPPEGGRSLGFIRLYLQKAKQER